MCTIDAIGSLEIIITNVIWSTILNAMEETATFDKSATGLDDIVVTFV